MSILDKYTEDAYDAKLKEMVEVISPIAEELEKPIEDVIHDLDHFIVDNDAVRDMYFELVGIRLYRDEVPNLVRKPREHYDSADMSFEIDERGIKDRIKDDLQHEVKE